MNKLRDSISFDTFFDINLDLLCIADFEGTFLRVNKEWETVLGYTTEELEGTPFIDKVHPDDKADTLKTLSGLRRGETILNFINRYRTREGSWRWIEWRSRPFEGHVYAAARDITRHIEAERRQEELTTAIEQATETIVITDKEGLIQYANPSFEKTSGYRRNEVLQQNPRILKSGLQPTEYYKTMWETISKGEVWEGEFINKGKDGHLFYEEVRITPIKNKQGEVTRYIAVKNDVTEKKLAQQELKENQELLDLFFQQSLDGFFFMMLDQPIQWPAGDSEETRREQDDLLLYVFNSQRITRINQAMLEQYKATEEDFIGLTPADFFEHDREQGHEVWRKFFNQGHLHIDTEEKRFDGSTMNVEGDYICLYDEKGRIKGHFGVQRDITRQRELEKALKEAAITDKLTGLYNRRHLFERLNESLAHFQRGKSPLNIAIMDIDHFKNVNDTYGHQMGDFVLEEMAACFRENTRPYDLWGRYGGEEFMLAATEGSLKDLTAEMNRLREVIREKAFTFEGTTIHITFSAGTASAEEKPGNGSLEALVALADERLYKAKKSGRNRVVSNTES